MQPFHNSHCIFGSHSRFFAFSSLIFTNSASIYHVAAVFNDACVQMSCDK